MERAFITSSQKEARQLWYNAAWSSLLVLVLWLVHGAQELMSYSFTQHAGIFPRTVSGLLGIITSPFIHSDWEHLAANSLSIWVLTWLMLTAYRKVAPEAMLWFWILSGVWTWCLGRPSYHIGASGVVYAQLSFILFSGIWRKDSSSMALTLLVVVMYGGFIWGILPLMKSQMSWEAHLSGFLAGLILSWHFREKNAPAKYVWPEEHYDTEYWLLPQEQNFMQNFENEPLAPSEIASPDPLAAPLNAQPVIPPPVIVIRYIYVPSSPQRNGSEQ
ncbi:Membrane associated serine protease, rhomboid family [Flexibacter flexilis DSM 6793]|uniref:Membrane associated serine protease, rhomboid family n=1 Tax=Flexibacter flexilis DSM 6793 TaxID=927664 RepID=A0A1I1FTQ4_9BACT|nr:rhomboid family intramembrane serine protease [Flexibacter flexilis]SFC02817.1 Membrane associated serine protease, rhomboid family [Flexibacter flexilis DSM 6793]